MVEVKLFSSLSAEVMVLFTAFSAAATWPWRKRRVLPICTARRSVGLGPDDFVGAGVEGMTVGGVVVDSELSGSKSS